MNKRLRRISDAVRDTSGATAIWNVAASYALEGRRDDAAFACAAAAYLVGAAHPKLGIRAEDLTALLLGVLVEDRVVMPPPDLLN